jgi:hypothetical protein
MEKKYPETLRDISVVYMFTQKLAFDNTYAIDLFYVEFFRRLNRGGSLRSRVFSFCLCEIGTAPLIRSNM